MPKFRVVVRKDKYALDPTPFDFAQLSSQNVAHAAASGLSLAGGGFADLIEVQVLSPSPGRPARIFFYQCSQGVYGFCYTSRQNGGGGA